MRMAKKMTAFLVALALTFFCTLPAIADGEEAIYASTDIKITGTSALLMEASTGQVLFEKQANEKLPIGTLNKIMTVLLVAEAIDEGKLSLSSQVSASTKASKAKGAVIWLEAGEKMSVEDLLKGVIIGNANDASIALAEAVSGTEEDFVARMNQRAKELGMANTVFKNCTGYDEPEQYSTAYDVALMSRELIKHKNMYGYMTCWMDNLRNGATMLVNANNLVKSYDGIVGIKAGYTEAAKNCISAAAERNGTAYVAVVLGCADKDARFSEAKGLMNVGFANYQVATPPMPEEALKPIKVSGGTKRQIFARAESLSNVVIPKGAADEITGKVILPEEISAPVRENQIIGEVEFYRGDNLLCKTNLLAGEAVEEMTFFTAFNILFKNMMDF